MLETDASSRARLRGSLRVAATYQLTVGVRSGDSCTNFQVPIEVSATPEITSVFPDACVGQPFELELSAIGGDAGSYEWLVEGVPELRLNGAHLSGVAPAEAGTRDVHLSLRDARCPAPGNEPVRRDLSWTVKGPGKCPQIVTTALPPPCEGIAYSEPLVASDGSGSGYVWTELNGSLPDGLAFDAARGLVHGTPTGVSRAGSLDVLLTDSAEQQAVTKLDLSLRSDCWLAFVADEPARLHVRDVFLATDDVSLPRSLPEGEAVRDLKFSPDGAWIAFRAGPAGQERLYLYPARGARPADAIAIPFACPSAACAVLDYVWSGSSTSVAVVLSGPTPEQDAVSGVSVAALSAPWPVASSVTFSGVSIDLTYLRDLIWIPEGRFAFVGRSGDSFATEAVYSAPEGLASGPLAETALDNQLRLRATREGWVATSAFSYNVTARTGSNSVTYGTAWISPSGVYAATTDDRVLSLNALSAQAPLVALPDACGVIAAWGATPDGTERIVCSEGSLLSPNGENLGVFDYHPGRDAFEPALGRRLPLNGSYIPGALANTRRMFSPTGDWLLLEARAETVVLARVPAGTTSLPPPVDEVSVPGAAEVQFRPDGRALLIYDQYGLRSWPIPYGIGAASLSSDAADHLVPPPALFTCEEEFWASPDNWCGAPRTLSHFGVSSDSTSVLLEGGDDSLWLTDLASVPQRATQRVATHLAPCPVSCAGSAYAFQP
jgi:hypothetical protein